jgi:hypothetical protein
MMFEQAIEAADMSRDVVPCCYKGTVSAAQILDYAV